MSYSSWFDEHALKHEAIVKRLKASGLNKDEVIEYFDFENMKENEVTFCPLYADNKKCHDMEELNCYICACPNFRFKDEGIAKMEDKTQFSLCSIESKDGKQGVYGEAIHQDCSRCTVPHHKAYVQKVFSWSWKEMMHACRLDT